VIWISLHHLKSRMYNSTNGEVQKITIDPVSSLAQKFSRRRGD